MRVHFDGSIYGLQTHGGVSRYVGSLLPSLLQLEPDLDLRLVVGTPLRQALPDLPGVPIIRYELPSRPAIRPERWTRSLRALWLDKSIQRRLKAVAHRCDFPGIWHSPYYLVPGNWTAPVVVTALDLVYFRFPELFSSAHSRRFRRRQQDAYRRADAILAISESTRRDLIDILGVEPARVRVVYPAVPVPVSRSNPEVGSVQPFVLSVGNRSAIKGFDVLLRAFSTLNIPDLELVVVGPEASPADLERVSELGIQARTQFVGPVSDEELFDLFARAETFVYPSVYEGFGIPLVEAMHAGCPIVASDIPTSREVAENVAAYFEVNNAEALAESLRESVESGRRNPRTALGVNRALEFSPIRQAERTLACYSTLG